MKIAIKSTVNCSMSEVWHDFNKELFLKLSPPFPSVKLLKFDGCLKNDIVSLELNFLISKQKWTSIITEQFGAESEIYFVDSGIELPFFLKFWQHKHRILKFGNKTKIIDEIEFKTPFYLSDFIFYPILYLQFIYRIPIYKKHFNKPSN